MKRARQSRAEELEDLFKASESEGESEASVSENDAVKKENSHDSETDADEEQEDEGTEQITVAEPARKRGCPAYLRPNSGFKWSLTVPEQRNKRSRSASDCIPSVKGDALNTNTPIAAWALLFTDDLLNIIVLHTNEEIERRIQSLKDQNKTVQSYHKHIALDELKAVIGLLYYASIHKISKSHIKTWWSIHSMPLFKLTMSRQRFEFLMICLRFDDKNTRSERRAVDKFAPMREIWDLFIANCTKYYTPDSKCTIGEQLLSFRGCCMKIVSLNDAVTHYMFNAIPCVRIVDKDSNEAVPSYYVRKLCKPIYNTGRNITCDNWFISIPLCKKLKNNHGLTVVGTKKTNKREILALFKKLSKNLQGSNLQFCYDDGKTLVSYNPKKNKIVLLSSLHRQIGKIDTVTKKPEIVLFYNKPKGGTDSFDQKCHQYSTVRKTQRWPIRFFYGMLDQVNVNAFILYNLNNNNQKLNRIDFMFSLCEALVKPLLIQRLLTPTLRLNLRLQIEEFVSSKDLPEDQNICDFLADNKMSKQKRCGLCPPVIDRKTYYKCLKCEKPMCREHVAKICTECSVSSVKP